MDDNPLGSRPLETGGAENGSGFLYFIPAGLVSIYRKGRARFIGHIELE